MSTGDAPCIKICIMSIMGQILCVTFVFFARYYAQQLSFTVTSTVMCNICVLCLNTQILWLTIVATQFVHAHGFIAIHIDPDIKRPHNGRIP